jgi:hypothetical protein
MDVSMKSVVRGVVASGLAGAVAMLSGCVLDPTYGGGYPGNGYPGGNYPGNGYPGQNYPQRPGYSGGQTVRCESNDGRYNHCSANTRGGVQLSRQLSNTQCVQNRNWGYDNGGIWVSNGCRAEFRTGYGGGNGGQYPGNGYGQTVRCESDNGRYRTCAATIRRGVQLSRQLSDTQCVQGRNWGWSGNSIWVNGGCRADFSVY